MHLISNLTLVASASSLVRILDFSQQHCFDLTNGGCVDFTPVQNYGCATGNPNQEWTLNGGPSSFNILSTKCNTFVTYPGAGDAIALSSQATTRSAPPVDWIVSLVNPAAPTGPWNIIEPISNAALTAWDHDPASGVLSSAPLTLETFD
ncbi:hypothetical protein C8R45DRAFT_1219929, partial [Mycena sanguinolenta]